MKISTGDKIQGIVYAYSTQEHYDMLLEAGIRYIRLAVPFPWKDRMFGECSEEWEKARSAVRTVPLSVIGALQMWIAGPKKRITQSGIP